MSNDKYIAKRYCEKLLSNVQIASYPNSITKDDVPNLIKQTFICGQKICSLCKKEQTTPAYFFITAVSQVLNRIIGEESLMLVLDDMLPFVSQICNHGILEAIQRTEQQYKDTKQNINYPVTKIYDEINLKPEIMLIYHSNEMEFKNRASNIALKINILPNNDDFIISVEYDNSRYNSVYIERLLSAIKQFVQEASIHTEMPCTKIPLLSREEELNMIALCSGETLELPEKTFIQMFKEKVVLWPDAVAIVD